LQELVALAELLGAPVYDEGMASRAMFPSSHPLYRGSFARLPAVIRGLMQEHDLLLSVGADLFTLSLPGEVDSLPEGMPIIHIDTDAWELGKNYAEKVSILGDPKTTLPELVTAITRARTAAENERARVRLAEMQAATRESLAKLRASAEAAAGRTPIHPLALMQAIADLLPANAVVIDETVSSGAGLRRFLKSDDAQSFYGLRGGGIGWGLPAAIGAKLALPERSVVALVGDGSAMYTIQALWTAAHEKLSMVFVIVNNTSYRILKQRVNAMKGLAAQTDTYVAMDLVDPAVDFVSVARGLGLTAHRATTIGDVKDLLSAGLRAEGPTLIDVAVDRNWKPV
jgi:benzoylformate decarboxylase